MEKSKAIRGAEVLCDDKIWTIEIVEEYTVGLYRKEFINGGSTIEHRRWEYFKNLHLVEGR